MWEIIQLMFFIYLGVLSVLDIQTGKLPVWLLTTGGICVILYQFVQKEIPWELCLAGAAVGGIFLMVSKVTQGNFGYGDSLLILLLGVGVGFWDLLSLLVIAFLLLSVILTAVLAFGKLQKKAAIPFVPFLWIDYIGLRMLGR